MRLRPQQQVRCGATLVEAGLVLGLFLTLVFGMIDLGIGVLRYHIVAEAARQGARIAIVHGNVTPPGGRPLSPWGPAPYSGRGSDQGEIPNAIRPYLIAAPARVRGGSPGDRKSTRLNSSHVAL